MQKDHGLSGRLRFGVFEVDLRNSELRKQGLKVRLQAQPFEVLVMLLEQQGQVVSREEIQKKLWPANTFVDFDHGLNKAINKIREALGDSAETPRFVETVARRGYRFLAEVHAERPTEAAESPRPGSSSADESRSAAPPPAEKSESQERSTISWKGLLVALLIVTAIVATWKGFQHKMQQTTRIHSLAVLPLESLSNDPSQDYFADGMTDELISDLGQIGALRVISRTSAMTYKHAQKPLPEIARELNVDAVVEGTVLRSGDRVRITAQLIDGATDKHLWSQSYEGDLRNTLALQSEVARAIAAQIQIKLNPQEQAELKNARTVNPQAYESYLKGRFFWNKRTAESLKVALAYFNQAIDEDPNYAQAYSGLADTYALLGDWQYAVMTTNEALPKAKSAARKALELDDALGEAHNSLAFVLDGFDWDFEAGGKEFRRAIELNPGYATAHHWFAWHLCLLGRYEDAIVEMKKAENLDPLSLVINTDLAEILVLARKYDEAILQSRKALEMDPNFALAHNHLGQAYIQKHLYPEAIAELKKAVELSHGNPTCIANLARVNAAAGNKSEALMLLNDLKKRSSPGFSHGTEIAIIYASLGNLDQAMTWLGKAYAERFNPGVLLRPGFDPLRADPRFKAMLRSAGMPPS
ncbi:MAG: tetratricopeptide repeat protein [Candidatus Acidiferrum sp.]